MTAAASEAPNLSDHAFKYYDNTRISDYRVCPRKFYLRHIRHWVPDRKSLALINGSSWHEAMDQVWGWAKSDISDMELLTKAYSAYVSKWVEEGLKHPDELTIPEQEAIAPRGPFIAREVLHQYINYRREFIQSVEVLDIERPFAIPILFNDEGLVSTYYIGRLDKVFKHPQYGKVIAEHKTTSWYAKEGTFRREWIEDFSPNSQVDGYLFAGNLLYNGVKGLWVDGALFHKKIHDGFKFIPIDRQFAMIDQWRDDTHYWIEKIEHDLKALATSGLRGVFAKNTSSCSMYGGCPYRDICRFYVDPNDLEQPPNGYKVEKWNPFDVLHIDRIEGMEPE